MKRIVALLALLTLTTFTLHAFFKVKVPDEWIDEKARAEMIAQEEFGEALATGEINILPQGEFDTFDNPGAIFRAWFQTKGTLIFTNDRGNNYIRMIAKTAKDATYMVEQFIPLPPGTERVVVTSRFRVKDAKWGARGYMKSRLRIAFIEGGMGGKELGAGAQVPDESTFEWQSARLSFPVPKGTAGVNLFVGFQVSSGVFDVDDIKVIAQGEGIKDYVKEQYKRRVAELIGRESDELFPQGNFGKTTKAEEFHAGWKTEGDVTFINENAGKVGDETYDAYARIVNTRKRGRAFAFAELPIEAGWEKAVVKVKARVNDLVTGYLPDHGANIELVFQGERGKVLAREVLPVTSEVWEDLNKTFPIPKGTERLLFKAGLTKATGTLDVGYVSVSVPGISAKKEEGASDVPGHTPKDMKDLNDTLDRIIKNHKRGEQPVIITNDIACDESYFDTNSGDRKYTFIYVDATNGSDENSGLEPDAPVKTLSNAVYDVLYKVNREGHPAWLKIMPGTYREELRIHGNEYFKGHTRVPLVFEAVKRKTVVISGSDIWKGWKKEGGYFVKPWPYKWGMGSEKMAPWHEYTVPNLYRRREMVFINKRLLRQVLTYEELSEPGTFLVDEGEEKLVMNPFPEYASEKALDEEMVEVAIRPLGKPMAHLVAIMRWNSALAFYGIRFEHTASYSTRPPGQIMRFGGALSTLRNDHILVEDCEFFYNNCVGLNAHSIFGTC